MISYRLTQNEAGAKSLKDFEREMKKLEVRIAKLEAELKLLDNDRIYHPCRYSRHRDDVLSARLGNYQSRLNKLWDAAKPQL